MMHRLMLMLEIKGHYKQARRLHGVLRLIAIVGIMQVLIYICCVMGIYGFDQF